MKIDDALRDKVLAEYALLRTTMTQPEFCAHIAARMGVALSPRTIRLWRHEMGIDGGDSDQSVRHARAVVDDAIAEVGQVLGRLQGLRDALHAAPASEITATAAGTEQEPAEVDRADPAAQPADPEEPSEPARADVPPEVEAPRPTSPPIFDWRIANLG